MVSPPWLTETAWDKEEIMKEYITPKINVLTIDNDVITASFGNLLPRPGGDDTPPEDLGGDKMDW